MFIPSNKTNFCFANCEQDIEVYYIGRYIYLLFIN